jgi:enoyl-CoA hydratase
MSETTEPAVLTERRGRVLLITLNRPDAMNAINTDLAQGLVAAIEELDGDPGLTAAVLTGAGRGFCSGMDLKAFAAGGPPIGFDRFIEQGAQKPLVAAVEGFALAGGLEVALTCDLIVAAANSKFGIPEANVGLFAAGGGLFRLPTRVGFGPAMEMALAAALRHLPAAHAQGGQPDLALHRDLELIEHLDRLGYHEAWIGEHHSAGSELIASPEVFIAAASQRTKPHQARHRRELAAVPPPVHARRPHRDARPPHRGRMMFGAGPGQLTSDAAMLGIDPQTSGPAWSRPST